MNLFQSPLWTDYLSQGKLPEFEVSTKTIVESVAYMTAGMMIALVVFVWMLRATEK